MSKNNLQIDKENKVTTMERVFDAPRELVYKAHTEAELVAKWWGPNKYETIVDIYDVRVGGKWRMLHKSKVSGKQDEHGFHGEFKELDPPNKITWTFEWEGMPGHVIVETMELFNEDGKTRIKTTSHYDSIEDLEGMVQSGMEQGATESWDRLETLVTSMKD